MMDAVYAGVSVPEVLEQRLGLRGAEVAKHLGQLYEDGLIAGDGLRVVPTPEGERWLEVRERYGQHEPRVPEGRMTMAELWFALGTTQEEAHRLVQEGVVHAMRMARGAREYVVVPRYEASELERGEDGGFYRQPARMAGSAVRPVPRWRLWARAARRYLMGSS